RPRRARDAPRPLRRAPERAARRCARGRGHPAVLRRARRTRRHDPRRARAAAAGAQPFVSARRVRRIARALVLLVVAIAVAAALALRSPRVQDALASRVSHRVIGRNTSALLDPNAVRVLLCGTASPIPSAQRAEACTAIFAGGRMWIVDTGPGSWRNLALRRVRGEAIGAIFYTHLHSDHIAELGEFNLQTWVAGRPAPPRVYGPDGVEELLHGLTQAYAADTRFRIDHDGTGLRRPERAARVPETIAVGGDGAARVLDEDGLVVTAFAVAHDPVKPAFGYRFDYGGRSVVISGDTAVSPNLVAHARGADVLVHEAQSQAVVHTMEAAAREAGLSRLAKILGDLPSHPPGPAEADPEAAEPA